MSISKLGSGQMLHDVFVSYAREDRERVDPYVAQLRGAGLDVWIDDRIEPGANWIETIGRTLRNSSVVLLFWSNAAERSTIIPLELKLAFEFGKRIVPVKLDKRAYSLNVRLILTDLQVIDGRRGVPVAILRKLADAIQPKSLSAASVIALLNMKGGVGKTTMAANIGAALQAREKSVLMIDLDPQANLSNLLVDSERYEERIEADHAVISAFEPSQATGVSSPARNLTNITPATNAPPDASNLSHQLTDPLKGKRLDLLVGQFELFKYSLPRNAGMLPFCQQYFSEFVRKARTQYDFILLDAAPSNSFITEMAVANTDHIIAPATPDKYAIRGLSALRRLVQDAYALQRIPPIHVLRNRVEPTETNAERHINDTYVTELMSARVPKSQSFAAKNPSPEDRVRNPLRELAFYRGRLPVKSALNEVVDELLGWRVVK
jgi:chromosome partitioning protein